MTLGADAFATQRATSTNAPQDGPHVARDRGPHAHQVVPHELRNAWQTAKQLEERLEVAGQPVLRRIARYIREQAFLALMDAEGYVEVDQR